jgi:glycogen phosphorylase
MQKMRKSMSTLTPQFSANRTVREYTEKYYLPAAEKYLQRVAEKGAAGIRIVAAHRELTGKWDGVHFGELHSQPAGDGLEFHVPVWLNEIDPGKVRISLYADAKEGGQPEKVPMTRDDAAAADGLPIYRATVKTSRPASDYTVRITPEYEGLSIPLEDNLIRWQG